MAMVTITGISWSLNLWVPLAMISAEIAKIRDAAEDEEADSDWTGDLTGVSMSIYNFAISVPQILSACICSGILYVLGEQEDHNALSWTLTLGGVASLVAAILIIRLRI